MIFIRKFFFVFILSKFAKTKRSLSFNELNFKKLDFTNNKQIKSFIFKKNFFNLKNKYVQSFDFLNFSKNLGGEIGINLSRNSILSWYKKNKHKILFPWSEDLGSRRLINIIYNFEFINSSATNMESKILYKLLILHMNRVIFDFNIKKINQITSYDLVAYILSAFILNKKTNKSIQYLDLVITLQIDNLGMHKSYNVVEHAKFINNLNEIKNIFLFFNFKVNKKIEETIIKMTSILNEYFHSDGSIPLFNGSTNNYTKMIYDSLNKDEYLRSRKFLNTNNGIAFYSNKNLKLFFDIVQPNKDMISNNLSAGTLSFEMSCLGEKIITNCGASESFGKNPEYLRYSAAHSTIILQNTNISEIKENNPHIRFPQSVSFNSENHNNNTIFEGSHNGYVKKFKRVIKRRLQINSKENKIFGEDSIIPVKTSKDRIIFHIRFHLVDGVSLNFTNNKKNIILKSKLNNMWLFKSETELVLEDSILVDMNKTMPTKQIVIKGVLNNNKLVKKWSLEKI